MPTELMAMTEQVFISYKSEEGLLHPTTSPIACKSPNHFEEIVNMATMKDNEVLYLQFPMNDEQDREAMQAELTDLQNREWQIISHAEMYGDNRQRIVTVLLTRKTES